MAFTVVRKQDWIVSTADGQPTNGWRLTIQDGETGETFNIDTTSLDPAHVQRLVQDHIDRTRQVYGLTWE